MGKIFERFPCPSCGYGALSEADLEAHQAHAHPSEGDGGGPPASLAPPPEVQVAVVEPPAPEPAPPPQQASTIHPALKVPQGDDTFWVDNKLVRLLHTVGKLSGKGQVVNVLLTGPKGTGKTSLPKEFAAAHGKPMFTVHCQLIAERDDWWGSKELSLERGTYFEKAAFLDAIETVGCVILLDEANRTHPENLNALFGFLDHRRRAWVPQLHSEVTVAPGVVFFVTLNEGYEYVGTNPIDEALRDRMTYAIRMGYVPKGVEVSILQKRTGVDQDTAEKLAEFARTARRSSKLRLPISTRQLLGAATLVVEGMDLQDSVLYSVVNGCGEDVDRNALLQALQVIGKVDDAYVSGETGDDEGEEA